MVETDKSHFHISLKERDIVINLKEPHRVISTCKVNGGIREGIRYIVIHQLKEGVIEGKLNDPASIHDYVSSKIGIDPRSMVLMLTAVQVRHMEVQKVSYKNISVLALSTAGVESNAGRAGDPSQVYEENGRFTTLGPSGTICTAVLVDGSMSPSALVEAVILSTEAKASVLQEMGIPSKYSQGIATGTGTDQICIASRLSGVRLNYSGKHTKLGEIMAVAVRSSIRKSLVKRDSSLGRFTGHLPSIMLRFGLDEKAFGEYIKHKAMKDPELVALSLSLAHIIDHMMWGNLKRDAFIRSAEDIISLMEHRLEQLGIDPNPIRNALLSALKGQSLDQSRILRT